MKKYKIIFVLLLTIMLLSASTSFGTAYAEQNKITHRLDIEYNGVTLVAVLTSGVITLTEWQQLKQDIMSAYTTKPCVIVTRDASIYHRVKNIENGRTDTEYIRQTFQMALDRNE